MFISGNLPLKTEITPLLIVIKLEQFDYNGAAALGFIMLVMSFVMLFAINLVQAWGRRAARRGGALTWPASRPGSRSGATCGRAHASAASLLIFDRRSRSSRCC